MLVCNTVPHRTHSILQCYNTHTHTHYNAGVQHVQFLPQLDGLPTGHILQCYYTLQCRCATCTVSASVGWTPHCMDTFYNVITRRCATCTVSASVGSPLDTFYNVITHYNAGVQQLLPWSSLQSIRQTRVHIIYLHCA